MKLTICILAILDIALCFLQAQPPQHGGQHGGQHQGHRPPPPPLFQLLDKNQDGALSAEEIEAAIEIIKKADANGDGLVALQELLPPPHMSRGGQQGQRPKGGQGQQAAPQIPRDYYRD